MAFLPGGSLILARQAWFRRRWPPGRHSL